MSVPPAKEPPLEVFLHGWLPAGIALAIVIASVAADLACPGKHWAQRAGSIVTVLGAYVAFVEARRSILFVDDNLYLRIDLPYKLISVALVAIGTLLWGYGDLLL